MNYYEVAPLRIVRPDKHVFTYESSDSLSVGQIVTIEAGSRSAKALIIKSVGKPSFATKPIKTVIDSPVVPGTLIQLASWLSEYYAVHLGLVLPLLIPKGIDKKRRQASSKETGFKRKRTNFVLNKDQLKAVKTISSSSPKTFLLEGVTGSGKTAVYVELAKQAIDRGKSALILVPEIALTSQVVAELSNHFPDVVLVHSGLSEATRHKLWLQVAKNKNPAIVIGPRSTLFLPLSNLGLIVVDECHEPSYKQESSPKYSALRAASMLGRISNAPVVFGSATPSITDHYIAGQQSSIIKLPHVARERSVKPNIRVIDMTKKESHRSHRFLSTELIENISSNLISNKQTLIFHNRRGSASTTLCNNCGWISSCQRCALPMTLHGDNHQLLCHICGSASKVPKTCPECGNVEIIFKGFGTKLIESELKKLFPKANIARFDGDNKSKETVSDRYEDLYSGKIDIAIGTQVLAKGLDLPNLRLVGVVQADSGLSLPDFSSNERAFQLLAQVVGRVGRSSHKTNVVVQTYQPSHPSVVFGIMQGYDSFYASEIKSRSSGLFPPFVYLLKLSCSYKTEASAIRASRELASKIRRVDGVQVLGPVPALYERLGGGFKWQLVVKSKQRSKLLQATKLIPNQYWQYELDPTSLL